MKSALIGICRAFGAQKRTKMAITVDTLLRVHSAISDGFARNHGHTYIAIRCVRASILIDFVAMLRKDNISSGKARIFDLHHCLLRGDMVSILQTQALWLRCRFGKTNQFRERAHNVPLQYTAGKLCPVLAYTAH